MRPVVLTLVSQIADPGAVALTQSAGNASNLLINGNLASGNVANFTAPSLVTVVSTGDDHAITFAITGTDANGNAISETVKGGNVSTVVTVHQFKTVTQIHTSGATAANVTSGTGNVGLSAPCPVDFRTAPMEIGLTVKVTGSATAFEVDYSLDDPWDPAYPDADTYNANGTWFKHGTLANLTATTYGNITDAPVRAVRLKSNQAGNTTGTLTVVQVGL